MHKVKGYLIRSLISIDQFANTLTGGWPDETLSSRCGRNFGSHWWWKALGSVLNKIDPNHIYKAMENEKKSLHEPPELR